MIINNFLEKEDLKRFNKQFKNLQSIGKQNILNDGDTSTERSTLTIEQVEKNDILNKFNIDLSLRPQNLDFNTYYKLTIEYEKLRS